MSQSGMAAAEGAIKMLPRRANPVVADSNLILIFSPGVDVRVFPYYTKNPPPCQVIIKDKQTDRNGG